MDDGTVKRSSRGKNDRIKYGTSCMQGADAMQDAHTAILELDGSDSSSLFGVFDGIGGDKQFHIELVKDPDYDNDLPMVMKNVFFRMYEKSMDRNEWRNSSSPGPQGEGTTACVAVIRGNQITVGNAGNSRCVLSRNGQAIDLSTDHKPDNRGKRARTEAAGDTIFSQEDATNRDGEIALSRALGDFEYKLNDPLTPDLQKMAYNPDIHTENITDDTEFLLLASEGIWQVTSSAEVVAFVHRYLQSGETDLVLICEKVIDWCKPSGNNSTVMLVQFKGKTLDILEELWYEVFLRLPSKMILRCRSVCKPWRDITTTPEFLERHHGLQKPQLLIVPVDNSRNMRNRLHRVLAINLQCAKDQFRPIISCTTFGNYKARDNEDEEKGIVSAVHASLDGMLLVSFDKTCYIINPATRKSSRLPALDNAENVLGLYKHVSSGQYRVLYERASEEGSLEEENLESFCTIALGSQLTRSIISLTSSEHRRLVFTMDGQPPAVIGDRLYWPPPELVDQITVFDTQSEVFNWMEPPAKKKSDSVIKLIELNGQLAASVSARGASKVELFKLVDPDSETWARHHVIELPVAEIDRFWAGRFESYFVSLNGDILVECVWRSWECNKKSPGKLFCCNESGEIRSLFRGYWGASPIHVLKESLITQSFLSNTDPALFESL